jgi:3-deoxy-D-manno-octulosonic-acid transferase
MRAITHSLAAVGALAAAPVAAGMLAIRPSWRVGFRERVTGLKSTRPGSIWIHAASVGETLAASRLVGQLRGSGRQVFTSSFTVSGREIMRRTQPEVPCQLAPLDHPWCVEAALDRIRPAALVLIETELWPSWIAAATRRKIPVMLISGRMSERSFSRYRRLGGMTRRTLRRLAAIGARTPSDADLFLALGADPNRISITGDLKIDVASQATPIAPDLEHAVSELPLFVAGSTHPGEEVAALAALDAVEQAGGSAALALAPRHIERAAEVEALCARAGRTARRRSALSGGRLARGEVLVMDTLGELASLYARANVAFVGGSMLPVGGHNILEPVFAGCPVLFGPHTANIRYAVELLAESGAGRRVGDAKALAEAVVEHFADFDSGRAAAQRGQLALLAHRGTTQRAEELIDAVLEPATDPIP